MFSESMLRDYVKDNLSLGDRRDVKSRWVNRDFSVSPDKFTNIKTIAFYPHFVLFETKNGFTETYTYWDVWFEFLGGKNRESLQ